MLLFLLACGDVILFNKAPSLGFISPQVEQSLAAHQPIVATARALDDIDPVVNLTTYWTLDGQPIRGEETIGTDGTITLVLPDGLPAGNPILRLRVVDASGESSTDKRVLNIVDDAPPSLTFVRPAPGGFYPAETPLQVDFIVDDDGAADLRELTLAWDGVANTESAPANLDGPVERSFTIAGVAAGENYAAVVVTDALGVSASFRSDFTFLTSDVDDDGHDDPRLGGNDCDDTDPTITDGDDYYTDTDGDGFGDPAGRVTACTQPAGTTTNADDCDDAEAGVNPDAVEVCDDIDNNCDDKIDNNAVDVARWYTDRDGDGFGAGPATNACDAPANTAANADDCNDACASCHPGGTEVCDSANVDEDCDSAADDADSSAVGTMLAYPDEDGDGRGDPEGGAYACDPPSSWVLSAGDCDDHDSLAWTGAAEACEDDSDNDCLDGDSLCTPSGDVDLSIADAVWRGSTLDFLGGSLAFVDDVDGDGLDDLAVGAWGNLAAHGMVTLVTASGMSGGSLSGFTAWTGVDADDDAGWTVASAGDVDGDGFGDLLIGAVGVSSSSGAAYLVAGSGAGGSLSGAAAALAGDANGDATGAALAGGSDVDGDGLVDVLIGASGAGKASLVHGPTAGVMAETAVVLGNVGFGTSLDLVDDMDGDGLSEMVVASPQDDMVFVFFGDRSGALAAADADVVWTGGVGELTGSVVARVGDGDGDGFGDLLIGAPGNSAAGSAAGLIYVVSGGGAASGDLSSSMAMLTGESASDRAGYHASTAGDVNGDGSTDLLLGAASEDSGGSGSGAAYLVLTPVSGTISLGSADAKFIGEGAGDGASGALAGGGDVNGDGFDDLAIGAPSENSGGGAAGAAYLILGGGG